MRPPLLSLAALADRARDGDMAAVVEVAQRYSLQGFQAFAEAITANQVCSIELFDRLADVWSMVREAAEIDALPTQHRI